METTMTPDGRFWDRMADRYAKQPIADPEDYARKLDITAGFLRPDMRLLEFGCGTGGTALHHAARVKEIHAVDVSRRMIEIAEQRRQAAGVENVRFMVDELGSFAPQQVRYDGVFAMSLLQLVADRDAALAKIRDLLRPGDLFVSSTMCIGDGFSLLGYIAPIAKAVGLAPTVRVFTTAQLRASITAAGFNVVHQWRPGQGKATFIVATAC